MMRRLDPNTLGLSVGLLSGLCMLLLSFFGLAGIYVGAVEMMKGWHEFYSLDPVGITTGILEGALWGYVMGWLAAWFYNVFLPVTGTE